MKRKCINFIVILVVLFQTFAPSFLFAESKKQPEVCSWPSEMMVQYFNFQKEIKAALWSEVDEKTFYASAWRWWLFTHWVLQLPSALDFVASNLRWNTKSNISTAITSMVLLLMASESVFQSNTEWLAILFKDRPIVRDYKSMLDIETDLFDTAYFYSKKVNLISKIEWKEVYSNMNGVIEKYRKSWLLADNTNLIQENSRSISDILQELISMNTAMKHFILFIGKPWTKALKNYSWCFWESMNGECSEWLAILRFSDEAIEQLANDYSGLSVFWSCSTYASNFKNSINKSISNNGASVKQSREDVKAAAKRLVTLFAGKSSKWNNGWKKWRCDLSDYEMAQLRAYRWPWWTCNENFVDIQSNIKDLFWNKKVKKKQTEKTTNLAEKQTQMESSNSQSKSSKNLSDLKNRSENWYSWFWGASIYNSAFSEDLYYEILLSNQEMWGDYEQSQNNAEFSDISYELSKIKWLLDTVDSSVTSAEKLRGHLKSISDYQCAY